MNRNTIIKQYLQQNIGYLKQQELISNKIASNIDISVVIPVYNEELCIPKIFLSLNSQTYRNFEVIIVDNGSTDRTSFLVRSWQSKAGYPLYLIKEPNKGVAQARKRGMDEVLLRVTQRGGSLPFHLIATTDADAVVPPNWLEVMQKAKRSGSLALAGTHQASTEIEFSIEQKLGIKNYFNIVPSLIEFLNMKKIGLLKMSGSNAAFEIEAYAAGSGVKQEYDTETGRVKLSEVNSLGKRVRQQGYPVASMGVRVITSRRRQLKEILDNNNSYFPKGYSNKDRFNVIREEERLLLQLALRCARKDRWIQYRKKMIRKILDNFVYQPLIVGELKGGEDYIDKLNLLLDKELHL